MPTLGSLYQGLGNDQTRVFVLHPRCVDEDIQITLREVSFNALEQYEAISYPWEGQEPSKNILCNGQEIQVTENLFDTLRKFRFRGLPRILWADALCIDQNNNRERSHQVQSMHRIFSGVKRVLVWLGKESSRDEQAISSVSEIAPIARYFSNDFLLHFILKYSYFDKLRPLFERGYFLRLWVVQETVLAKEVVLPLGDIDISWDLLLILARLYIRSDRDLMYHPASLRGVRRILAMASARQEIGHLRQSSHQNLQACSETPFLSWFSILHITINLRQFEVTDPRDRVFALLGLIYPDKDIFQSDYSLTLWRTFRAATLANFRPLVWDVPSYRNVERSDSMDSGMLPLPWLRTGLHRSSKAPTWVVDFNSFAACQWAKHAVGYGWYAGGIQSMRASPNLSDELLLRTSGVPIGTIVSLLDIVGPQGEFLGTSFVAAASEDLQVAIETRHVRRVELEVFDEFAEFLVRVRKFVDYIKGVAVSERDLAEECSFLCGQSCAEISEADALKAGYCAILDLIAAMDQFSGNVLGNILSAISFSIDDGKLSRDAIRQMARFKYAMEFWTGPIGSSMTDHRQFQIGRLDGGTLVWVPKTPHDKIQPGRDSIHVFEGAIMPTVLRAYPWCVVDQQQFSISPTTYEVLGPAYVQGYMKGEVMYGACNEKAFGLAESLRLGVSLQDLWPGHKELCERSDGPRVMPYQLC
ncbi:MAG: hypothetical protein Q9157_003069 [Trypethelium eluteriae]